MLSSDLGYLELQPWAPLFPGIPMMLTVGALNILADCIREASDVPRKRRGLLGRLRGRTRTAPSGTAVPDPAIPTEEFDRVPV
jgi:peptide/nickel transport system permease protein